MNTINKLLDEAKEKGKYESDNQLAIAIKVTRTTISFYRHEKSTPDVYVMQRLAQITNRSLEQVTAMIQSEHEKNSEKRDYWKEILKRIGGTAASFVFTSALLIEGVNNVYHCILC